MEDNTQKIFQKIYASKAWGGTADDDFCSGPGSYLPELVAPYLEAIRSFAAGRPRADAVDLGCGDFNIGSQLRHLFGRYVACDIVPELIERNARRFGDLDVEFRCLDLSRDALPPGDIVFLRYVLQHLSNERIATLVPKLAAFRYLIITEGLCKGEFVANADIPSGAAIRPRLSSGVVLTEPPFNLPVRSAKLLSELPWRDHAIIKTILYEL